MPELDPLPAIKTPWGSATPPSGASASDVPPIPVPDHTLIRRIGKGSYGEVWLARNVLGIYRAVKIVHRRAFDDDRPFEREFAGIQRFEPVSRSHESQLNILHVGRGPDCFYYVMELADDMGRGAAIDEASYTPRNLRSELLLRGRLPADECLRLGLALTTALENLHRHRLVHRDIKPSNIVFVNGIPKLADIGLVALAESTMSFVGTEGYLPPEGPGTVQADLFSLGKVLYEISTGHDRQQFPELPTGITELPDRAALAEFNEVLLRACAPDLKQRYESAAEMHADLALLQSGKSVARLRAVERRLKFVARAGAAVTGIALVAGAAFVYQHIQTREARRLAGENKALAEAKTLLADEKARLSDENRERVVRLDIANGVRLLDEGDAPGALLWFADALPLLTNKPAEESIHRIRIQQAFHQIPRVLQVMAHESAVLACDLSPDGRQVATGTLQGQIRLWDTQSGALMRPPLAMSNLVLQVCFSADGRRLLVSSAPPLNCAAYDHTPGTFAAVLDAASGQEIFPRLTSNIDVVAFSADGRWLATAMSDHVIRLIDARDGRLLTELKGHINEIIRLSFNADSKLLASAGLDRTARLWRLPTGEPLGAPLQHEKAVRRVILSDDGRRVLTSTDPDSPEDDCVIQAWDTQTGRKLGQPFKEAGRVNGLFFDRPDGKRFFTAGQDPHVRMWDTEQNAKAKATLEMNAILSCWTLSADGSRLAVGSDDHRARIWNSETGELLSPPLRHTAWVSSVRLSPDGKLCLTTGSDGTAKLWALDLQTPPAAVCLDAPILQEGAECFARDLGRQPGLIPILTRDGSVRLLDPERRVEVHKLVPAKAESPPNRCVAAPQGRQWAAFRWEKRSSQSSETIDLWGEQDGHLQHFPLNHPGVTAVAFRPDGVQLLTAGKDEIRVWTAADGALKRRIPMPQTNAQVWAFSADASRALLILQRSGPRQSTDVLQVFDLELAQMLGPSFRCPCGEDFGFDPQGNRVAAVSQDSWARIFDAHSGGLASPPCRLADGLMSLDWSEDGRRLLVAGLSSEAVILDTLTGEQLLSPMQTGTGRARIARWSPDGRFIATRSQDGFARLWDAATAEAITPLLPHQGVLRVAAVTRSGRLLTVSEPNQVRTWDLTETRLPPGVLADYARLASGRRLSANGALLALKAEELATLAVSLRARVPQLFVAPPTAP